MMTGLYPAATAFMRTRGILPAHAPDLASPIEGCRLPHRVPSCRRSSSRAASVSRAASISTTTRWRLGQVERTRRPRQPTPHVAHLGPPSLSRCFSGCTTSIPHTPYAPPRLFGTALTRNHATSAESRARWIDRWPVSTKRSSRMPHARVAQRPSSLPGITARASATTASFSTATCSINRRCTCPWWWWDPELLPVRRTHPSASGESFTQSSIGPDSRRRTVSAQSTGRQSRKWCLERP